MLISLKNVSQFVDLKGLSAEEIAHGLTFAGIEVEEISHLASGTNLVIGHVIECEKHPDSDHLHVLKVDLGEKYGVKQIVCGAPNARKDLKVIVAMVGAKLPEIEIKKGVIRGVESDGMCCSLLELGVDSKYLSEAQTRGIEELPDNAPTGEENVLGFLGLDDAVLNLNVLANRPDLLSVYNVAREIGAIFNREVKIPKYSVNENFTSSIQVGSNTLSCSQFSIREITDVKVKESPDWLKNDLRSMGIRSINNIVDIGNYVMLMTGQPLHMYDADKLPGDNLFAEDTYEGDFVALDEKTYAVQEGDIVITSNREPMCLGGVMGSLKCAVDENSKHIYIESASFLGSAIRHTSNRLGLASESSSRFVKGTNHFQSEYVLDMAASLIKELCSAKKVSQIVCYQNEEEKTQMISSSVNKINNRLGTDFTAKEIKETLERLSFKTMMDPKGDFTSIVPQWRLDITSDADLSEEVIRLLGFEHVKSALPVLDTKLGAMTLAQERLKQIRTFLLENGLDECLTYSLISKKELDCFNLLKQEEPYKVLNPLTDEHEYFRVNVLHSLLKVATYNVAHQNKNLALFETSHIQSQTSLSTHLAIVLVGQEEGRGLMSKLPYDFFHMKGLVEGIMTLLGIDATRYKFDRFSNSNNELHPGRSATISFQGSVIGYLGELHPNALNKYDLGKTNAVVLEIDLGTLLSAKVSGIKMSPISKFPFVQRDLAFVVDKNVSVKDIIKTIKVTGKGLVSDANVFDIYEGKGIEENKKSIAISVTYSKLDSTLQEKEVSDMEDKIKFELTKTFRAELRG